MSNTLSHPYQWLKTLPSTLLKLDKTPSLGHSPPFHWDELSKKLSALFDREIKVSGQEMQMRSPEEFLLGAQDLMIVKHSTVQPLPGVASFVLPKSCIKSLIGYLIKKEGDGIDQYDPEFQESFTQFLAMEVLYSLSQINFDRALSFQLLDNQELPTEPSHCLDIEIALPSQTLHGRLIISPQLSQAWKERYNQQQFDLLLKSAIAKNTPVTVHLEAGRVVLSPGEWKELRVGDFVLLDSCSLQPGDNKGRVMLTVNQRPFMRGKLKDGQLKLLEPVALVTGATMENQESPTEGEAEVPPDDLPLEEEAGEAEEIDLSEEETPSVEEEVQEGEAAEAPPQEAAAPQVEEKLAKLSADTLPMTIVIEVARIQMPLKQLLDLQPGSLIDLEVSPQSGVDLVINGQKIGKGELLLIGETLGVRILDL